MNSFTHFKRVILYRDFLLLAQQKHMHASLIAAPEGRHILEPFSVLPFCVLVAPYVEKYPVCPRAGREKIALCRHPRAVLSDRVH